MANFKTVAKIIKATTGETSIIASLVTNCNKTAVEFTNAEGDLIAFKTVNKKALVIVS